MSKLEEQSISKEAIRKALKDYWHQYTLYPWRSLIGFTLPAFGTVLVFYVPPLILGRLVDLFIAEGIALSSASYYITLLGILWLSGEVLWRAGLHLLIGLEAKGINNLARVAFQRLAERDYDFYTNNFVGSLTKKAMAFARGFETFTDTLIFNVIANIFPLIFVVIVLWRYSPLIPAILIICLGIVLVCAWPIMRRRSKIVAERHIAGSSMVGRLSDSLSNILAVKSFAKEKREHQVYGGYVTKYTSAFKRAADYHNIFFSGMLSPLYVGTNIIGLIAAIFFAQRLGLQAGSVVIVFSYYSLVTKIFWEINHTYRNIEASVSEAGEFNQMFLNPPQVEDAPGARRLKVSKATLAFNSVNFKYGADQGDSFLRNFSLVVEPNQKVGLVGPSGGGKTTITKLLLRFIDLQGGSITIDDQDISRVTQVSLREAIAYVPQEPLLFHRSLFENIAYGNDKADEKDIIRAARLAHADEFIKKLPQGYETLVGERGVKLSGGQRQRIAIARAILKNAPILILDEATSSLDSESEKYIQEGLRELMKDKTALVIAHRLSTIRHLDRILVLDHGKIVQDGKHSELIKQKGLYATLWNHQTGEFL